MDGLVAPGVSLVNEAFVKCVALATGDCFSFCPGRRTSVIIYEFPNAAEKVDRQTLEGTGVRGETRKIT